MVLNDNPMKYIEKLDIKTSDKHMKRQSTLQDNTQQNPESRKDIGKWWIKLFLVYRPVLNSTSVRETNQILS